MTELSCPGTRFKENFYYVNGQKNTEAGAESGRLHLENLVGAKVGLFHNETSEQLWDLGEYATPGLNLKDIMNAYQLERLGKNGNEMNVVVMFSQGNKDMLDAMNVMALEGRSLGESVNFISIGSPVGKDELVKAVSKVGGGRVEQYNLWRDPVVHHKIWIRGVALLGGWGLIKGASIGFSAGSCGLGSIFGSFMGGGFGVGLGGVLGLLALRGHSFEGYLNEDVRGVRTRLEEFGDVLTQK